PGTCQVNVRLAGAGLPDRSHPHDHLYGRPRKDGANVSRDRGSRRAPSIDAPRLGSAEDREGGPDRSPAVEDVRLLPGEAAIHTGRGWLAAGSLDNHLRQRHQRRQWTFRRRPAPCVSRRRIGRTQGRPPYPVSTKYAACESELTLLDKLGIPVENFGDSNG